MIKNKIFIKAVSVTFLLILSGVLVNVSAIRIDNDIEEQKIYNSSLKNLNNKYYENLPITISQYKDGRIIKTYQKEITHNNFLKIFLKILKDDESEEILDVTGKQDIAIENGITKNQENTINLFIKNVEENIQNEQMLEEFSFVEYNTPLEILKAGVSPLAFGTTGLGYVSFWILLYLTAFLTSILDYAMKNFPEHEELINMTVELLKVPLSIITSPLWLSILAGRLRPIYFYRPAFYWLGGAVLGGIKIKTREHEYVGTGYLEAELNGFSGIYLDFGFYSYLAGHVTRIAAKGEVVE